MDRNNPFKLSKKGKYSLSLAINILGGFLWLYLGYEQIQGFRLLNETVSWSAYLFLIVGVIQLISCFWLFNLIRKE